MLYYVVMDEQENPLKFPCDFPIKAMGRIDSACETLALEVIRRHVPDFDPARMHSRASRNGNYLSVTFTVRATSREQLDAIYRGLTACDELLMVL